MSITRVIVGWLACAETSRRIYSEVWVYRMSRRNIIYFLYLFPTHLPVRTNILNGIPQYIPHIINDIHHAIRKPLNVRTASMLSIRQQIN